jgi:hypothetical protein
VEPAPKEAVTPLGRPLAERETVPEKPPTSVIVIVVVSLPPWAIDTVVGEAESVKPGTGFTVKLWVTGVAAAQALLPAWLASMVQIPEAINVAVVPETVQMLVVVEVKATGRPELAVAESASGEPTVCAGIVGKVMVCALPLMVKLC